MSSAGTETGSTDPSAALLERIAAEALNPAYPAQATADGPARRSRGRVLVTAAVLGAIGLMVGVLVVASRDRAVSVDSERGSLLVLVEAAQSEVAELEGRVAELQLEVRALRAEALGTAEVGTEQAEEVARLAVAAGTQPVQGPGARVDVADGDPALGDVDESLARVLDFDLQHVVNGLWEAGAEAVAVNGQRVGPLTAIRAAQDVILVNYNPVVGPYRVEAIGDPRSLATGFATSSGGEWLKGVNLSVGIRYSIEAVSSEQTLTGEPTGPLYHARPATPADLEASS